jgi:acyl-CoA synthetase (AMP-forming)/AMP-acid ligase II
MQTPFNVATALRNQARARPDAPALRFPAADYQTDRPRWDEWSYGQLDRESDALAAGLASEAGFVRGERVVVMVRPSLRFYALLFALFKLGAVPVLLDPGMGMGPLLRCVRQIRPTALVAISPVHAVRQFVRGPFATVQKVVTDGSRWFWGGTTLDQCRKPQEAPFPLAECGPDDDAAILFTSGSTGTPKGVVAHQAMLAAEIATIRAMFGFGPGGVMVQCFAAFALFDLSWGHLAVIPKMDLSRPASADPADILAAVEANGATVAFASPIVWQNVLRYCEKTGKKLTSLGRVVTVGAPIPAYLHQRLLPYLAPGTEIATPYGATEGMPVTWVSTGDVLAVEPRVRAGEGVCVGRPAPGIQIRLARVTDEPIPEWTDATAAPAGEIGEICISGDQVSREYRDLPEANALAKIREGSTLWHRMGDLGRWDDDGRLWFCGRKGHRLTTKQGLVPNVPVEQVFNAHPAVFRSALVGLGSPGDQLPFLLVELETGHGWTPSLEAELRDLAKGTRWEGVVQGMAPHPGFPTDARHNSKIRNEDLREWATARGLGRTS